jgi:hypothetical protein
MQGHPESPRLWKKHADKILCKIGLMPTVYESCLYSGIINDNRVLFMQRVDDFAISALDTHTSDIFMDLINDCLKIPIKRQGYLDMYNRVDILQTRYYIKMSVQTYIDKICEPYFSTPTPARSTPLPSDATWLKKFNAATGNVDPNKQAKLAKSMQLNYRSGVGELIWAMTTCQPDLAIARVKLSQSNSCPHELHFHSLKHALKFMYNSWDDGLYFWHTAP